MMARTPATDRLAEIEAWVEEWNSTKLVREGVPWLITEIERLKSEVMSAARVRPRREENEALRAEVERLRSENALIDECAFALRGNYPEVLRDFDSMPAEIERLHSDHNDVIEENLSLRAALNDAHTALANVLKTHRAFTEEHGPLLDYSTSAEMVDFDIALNAARAAVVGETTTEAGEAS